MIKSKIIRKIFITTVTMFILLTVFSIPIVETEDVLKVNMEVVENDVYSNSIYLLNNNGYLVKSKILLEEGNIKDNVLKILSNLIVSDTSKYVNELKGTIPKDTKVRDVFCGNELVTIDFSKEFLDVSLEDEKNMISSIVYSILDIDGVKGVSILVEGERLDSYPKSKEKLANVLTKSIGINKEYDIKSRENISSVVVYYLEDIENELYYVPVTKYLNDDRDKIKIIVEELTTSYIHEENLMSFLNNKVELIDYKEENDILFLNFNEYLYDSEDKILEEVIYSISYSVFDNYNVSMVMFEVNGEEVSYINRK
ncbi:MAG: GerMN domain-containing protein [Bacilli bacterium]|nr:GerMN domain-containing protein [Bacilli bacterium]